MVSWADGSPDPWQSQIDWRYCDQKVSIVVRAADWRREPEGAWARAQGGLGGTDTGLWEAGGGKGSSGRDCQGRLREGAEPRGCQEGAGPVAGWGL